jgi:hypothetical protein
VVLFGTTVYQKKHHHRLIAIECLALDIYFLYFIFHLSGPSRAQKFDFTSSKCRVGLGAGKD